MKLSISTGTLESRYGTRKMFQLMKAAGIEYADYGLDTWMRDADAVRHSKSHLMSLEETIAHYKEVRRIADEEGITIYQTHAIFGEFPACDVPEYREATLKNIVATNILGAKYSVIHPVRTLGRFLDEEKEYCFQYNLELFRYVLPYLEKYDVTVGIEPMWLPDENDVIHASVCSRPEEILEFIDVLNSDRFCSCPDYGHIALTGKETGDTVGGALRKLGKTVKCVHIHEVDGIKDRHTVPFTYPGVMDWVDIASAMREIGYEGTVNFEIGGNFYNRYPDSMMPEALRHLAEIGKFLSPDCN
ncbi:MAG: sugar phosphate isomerase/epimerase [Clostridia bacterium]|nr:sugar phosphate isomerase/epimerase [Clostridia bacterium]